MLRGTRFLAFIALAAGGLLGYGAATGRLGCGTAAQAAPQDQEAVIPFEVLVPADATLDIGGFKTNETGEVRHFQTPPLRVGGDYTYTVKATYQGKEVTRDLNMKHGASNVLDLRADFQAAAPRRTPIAAKPSKLSPQVPIPTTAAQVPGPVPGNTMTKEYVQLVGRMAYVWGFPLVNAHNRRAVFAKAPEPGLLGGVVPIAPIGFNQMLTNYITPDEKFIVCPNQDVVYGGGFTALDKEPTVIQVPDFGDRFYVYAMYDQRTDEIGRIGKQYGSKPGHYMLVGQNWKGEVPKGINAVIRSSTGLVFIVPRIFKDSTPEDTAAVQTVINQLVMYPLSQFDGKMKTKDYSKSPHFPVPPEPPTPKGENKWVNPKTYYEELPVVMKEVPPLPGEEALYGWIASVWEAAATNPETRKALVESFVAADAELLRPLFQFQYNGRPVGNGWTVPANASAWGTDYLNRTAISRSSMYQNTSAETRYNLRELDGEGQPLDGNTSYSVTFA